MTHSQHSSFKDFEFNQFLQRAIEEAGFSHPTPIQEQVIPHISLGKDVIAKAQTGSGKTAAFCLPMLHIVSNAPETTILIMTPTRELALQVCEEMKLFSKHLNIHPTAVYGGESIIKQLKQLKQHSQIIVGTPGRLLDLMRSKRLKGFKPSLVVLDEADEMLNMGFLDDIQSIFSFLPEKRQTLLFSATMSPKIKKIAKQFLTDPKYVEQACESVAHQDIHQLYYLVPEKSRKQALLQTLLFHKPKKAIIFCNTKRQVEELSSELAKHDFPTLALQGDMSQKERNKSIEQFRSSSNVFLVATDVAGRGINVSDVCHVFNYEIPYSAECYTHRIGRTGRMGSKGTAITLVSPKQKFAFSKFPQIQLSKITFQPLPSIKDIKSQQQKHFAHCIEKQVLHEDAKKIMTHLLEGHCVEDIALKLISKHLHKQSSIPIKDIALPTLEEKASSKKRQRNRGFKRGQKFRGNRKRRFSSFAK